MQLLTPGVDSATRVVVLLLLLAQEVPRSGVQPPHDAIRLRRDQHSRSVVPGSLDNVLLRPARLRCGAVRAVRAPHGANRGRHRRTVDGRDHLRWQGWPRRRHHRLEVRAAGAVHLCRVECCLRASTLPVHAVAAHTAATARSRSRAGGTGRGTNCSAAGARRGARRGAGARSSAGASRREQEGAGEQASQQGAQGRVPHLRHGQHEANGQPRTPLETPANRDHAC